MTPYSRIFASIDRWETTSVVAERAIALAEQNGAQLLFGHVVDARPYEMAAVDLSEIRANAEASIRDTLDKSLQAVRATSAIPSAELKVRIGKIEEELRNLIHLFCPDLIVCGVRETSSIHYLLRPSISRFLVHNASCDVMVVKPNGAQRQSDLKR